MKGSIMTPQRCPILAIAIEIWPRAVDPILAFLLSCLAAQILLRNCGARCQLAAAHDAARCQLARHGVRTGPVLGARSERATGGLLAARQWV